MTEFQIISSITGMIMAVTAIIGIVYAWKKRKSPETTIVVKNYNFNHTRGKSYSQPLISPSP